MAKDKHIFRTLKNKNYTVMSNVHLRDKKLSWKAKGIHSYVLSLPDDWEIRVNHLITVSTDGEKSTRSGLKELYDNKYWQKYPVYINGKVDHWVTLISEVPFKEEEIIKSVVYRDGKEIINYKFRDEEEIKEDKIDVVNNVDKSKNTDKPKESKNLLSQKGKVDEVVENTNVELLSQKVEVGKVEVENEPLLNTNNTNNLFITNNLVSQSKDKTDRTELFNIIKNQAQLDLYIFEEDRKLLEVAIDRLINSSRLKVGDRIFNNEQIIERLLQLRLEMCDLALSKYRQALHSNPDINNKLQYFCVLLFNVIDEYYAENNKYRE